MIDLSAKVDKKQGRNKMTAYEIIVTEYNNKIASIVADNSLTSAQRFIKQIELKTAYETPIAKAFLATIA